MYHSTIRQTALPGFVQVIGPSGCRMFRTSIAYVTNDVSDITYMDYIYSI